MLASMLQFSIPSCFLICLRRLLTFSLHTCNCTPYPFWVRANETKVCVWLLICTLNTWASWASWASSATFFVVRTWRLARERPTSWLRFSVLVKRQQLALFSFAHVSFSLLRLWLYKLFACWEMFPNLSKSRNWAVIVLWKVDLEDDAVSIKLRTRVESKDECLKKRVVFL